MWRLACLVSRVEVSGSIGKESGFILLMLMEGRAFNEANEIAVCAVPISAFFKRASEIIVFFTVTMYSLISHQREYSAGVFFFSYIIVMVQIKGE